jgi:hypothetical protein
MRFAIARLKSRRRREESLIHPLFSIKFETPYVVSCGKELVLNSLLGATLLLAGCSVFQKHTPAPKPAPPVVSQRPGLVIKPDLRPAGQVAMVNVAARFVVISFPPGSVPPVQSQLYVYRNGLKVGALKVTGPQRENDTVADIISGDIHLHDEVRTE